MNNQMPMGGGMQPGPNPYMQQPMQQQPVQQPAAVEVDPEKKKKLINKLIKLGIILVIVLVVIFGKKYLNYITIDYKSQVDTALTKFYVSDSAQDLEPIKGLLETYKKNPKMIQNIQNYTYSQVGNWFTSTFYKFPCDQNNYNTCLVALQEFNKLLIKLDKMYAVKGGGYFVISTAGYQELKSKGNSEVDKLTGVTNNRGSYSSPQNSETIHTNQCRASKDCNCNTNTGVCACKYETKDANGNTIYDDVTCYKADQIVKR